MYLIRSFPKSLRYRLASALRVLDKLNLLNLIVLLIEIETVSEEDRLTRDVLYSLQGLETERVTFDEEETVAVLNLISP